MVRARRGHRNVGATELLRRDHEAPVGGLVFEQPTSSVINDERVALVQSPTAPLEERVQHRRSGLLQAPPPTIVASERRHPNLSERAAAVVRERWVLVQACLRVGIGRSAVDAELVALGRHVDHLDEAAVGLPLGERTLHRRLHTFASHELVVDDCTLAKLWKQVVAERRVPRPCDSAAESEQLLSPLLGRARRMRRTGGIVRPQHRELCLHVEPLHSRHAAQLSLDVVQIRAEDRLGG